MPVHKDKGNVASEEPTNHRHLWETHALTIAHSSSEDKARLSPPLRADRQARPSSHTDLLTEAPTVKETLSDKRTTMITQLKTTVKH